MREVVTWVRNKYGNWVTDFGDRVHISMAIHPHMPVYVATIRFDGQGATPMMCEFHIPSTDADVAKKLVLLELVQRIDDFIKPYALIKRDAEAYIFESAKEVVCKYV